MQWVPRLAKLLGVLVLALVAVLAVLIVGFGMRVAPDGSGLWPVFSFRSRDDHFAALERQRAAQRGQAPAIPTPAASSSSAAPAAPVPVATPAAPASASATPPPVSPVDPPPATTTRVVTPGKANDWPDFRGPQRDGVYRGVPLHLPWPDTGPALLWKQPIGEGYASFVVANGHAFTIEQRRQREVVAAYEIESGRELWTHAWDAEFRERMGGDGPRATPTWHDGRLYALGASGELRCLRDTDGSLIWRRDILQENGATNLQWGMSASPFVIDDKVIVLPGGHDGHSVVAYDRLTGAPVWNVLDDKQAYTAPMAATLLGTRQLVIVTAKRVVGLSVADGGLLWEYPWQTDNDINVSQPIVVADNRLFISAGYGHGAAVFELSRDGAQWRAQTVWENTRMKNRFASSVLYEGHVYGLDEGILACVDVATGDQKWKGGRYGHGQLLLAGNHLIVLTERGELALVQATPASFREIALVPAIEGKTWNHPSLADGRLLLRNASEMAAFDLRATR